MGLMTTKKKKVILLIVEGGTEAESFQDFINEIERDRAVYKENYIQIR